MKGLIVKDMLVLRRALLSLALLLALELATVFMISLVGGGMLFSVITSVITVILAIADMTIMISFASVDEQCRWDSFASSFPIARTKVVLARYLSDLLVLGLSEAVLLLPKLLGRVVWQIPVTWLDSAMLAALALLIAALMNPVTYRFGAQVSGYLIAGVSMAIGMGGTLWGNHHTGEMSDEAMDTLMEQMYASGVFGKSAVIALLLGAGAFVLSAWVSILIYRKKSF